MSRHGLLSILLLIAIGLPAASAHAECPYEFTLEWGSYGTGPDQFAIIWDIARTPDGAILVADYRNDRIRKFDTNGNLLLSFGQNGTGPGQFRRPIAVATDGAGNILVVEQLNFRLQKFTANGVYVTEWPLPGEGQYQDILDVAADQQGNVYVPDPSQATLLKFGPDGTLMTTWSFPNFAPGGVTFDENDVLYVYGSGSFYMKLDTGLNVLQSLTPPLDPSGTGFVEVQGGLHYYPMNADVDAVRVYSEGGALLCGVGTAGTGPEQVDQPRNAVPMPDGCLIVSDALASKLVRYDPVAVPAATTSWGRVKSVYR